MFKIYYEGLDMTEAEVIQKVKDLVEFYNQKFCIALKNPKVEFHDDLKTFGHYYIYADKISYSRIAMEYMKEDFMDVVIHEVAHKVTIHLFPDAKQMHGPQFKMVARLAGGSGSTYVDQKLIPKSLTTVIESSGRKTRKFEYSCSCNTKHLVSTVTHNRIQAGKKKLCCVSCRSRISFVQEVK